MVVYNMWAMMAAIITALVYAPLVYFFGDLVTADTRVLAFVVLFGVVGTVLEFGYKISARLFWLPVWFWGVVAIVGSILDALGMHGMQLFGTTAAIAVVAGAVVLWQIRRLGGGQAARALASARELLAANRRPYRTLARAIIVAPTLNVDQRKHTTACLELIVGHFARDMPEALHSDVEALLTQLRAGEGEAVIDPSRLERMVNWLNEQAAFA